MTRSPQAKLRSASGLKRHPHKFNTLPAECVLLVFVALMADCVFTFTSPRHLPLTCESQADHLVGQLECVGPVHRPRPLYPGAALSAPRHACPGRAGDGRRPEHTPSHTKSRTPMCCGPLLASIHDCSRKRFTSLTWKEKKKKKRGSYHFFVGQARFRRPSLASSSRYFDIYQQCHEATQSVYLHFRCCSNKSFTRQHLYIFYFILILCSDIYGYLKLLVKELPFKMKESASLLIYWYNSLSLSINISVKNTVWHRCIFCTLCLVWFDICRFKIIKQKKIC